MESSNRNKMAEQSFKLILHAGNARSSCMEALEFARNQRFEEANEKFVDATKEFHEAHTIQTELLVEHANGAELIPDILMVHAQDHFTSALICMDLCKEMTIMYQFMMEIKGDLTKGS